MCSNPNFCSFFLYVNIAIGYFKNNFQKKKKISIEKKASEHFFKSFLPHSSFNFLLKYVIFLTASL